MARLLKILVLLGLVGGVTAGVWVWVGKRSKTAGPGVLRERIDVFPSPRTAEGWRTDWSWDTSFQPSDDPREGLVCRIQRFGGVAFRGPGTEAAFRLPAVGYLTLVIGPVRVLPALTVSLHDGEEDLQPEEGVRLTSPRVLRRRQGEGVVRVSIPLSLFRPAGSPVYKVNIMNKSPEPVVAVIHEVAFSPADEEADRQIEPPEPGSGPQTQPGGGR